MSDDSIDVLDGQTDALDLIQEGRKKCYGSYA